MCNKCFHLFHSSSYFISLHTKPRNNSNHRCKKMFLCFYNSLKNMFFAFFGSFDVFMHVF